MFYYTRHGMVTVISSSWKLFTPKPIREKCINRTDFIINDKAVRMMLSLINEGFPFFSATRAR